MFLIGNKLDLDKERKVSKEDAQNYKDEYKLNYFTECSAKTGMNAEEVFVQATRILYDDYQKYRSSVSKTFNNNFY